MVKTLIWMLFLPQIASVCSCECVVSKGVDLSIALNEVCEAVGGSGGGHQIASGGSFPSDLKNEFLRRLDTKIGAQFTAK